MKKVFFSVCALIAVSHFSGFDSFAPLPDKADMNLMKKFPLDDLVIKTVEAFFFESRFYGELMYTNVKFVASSLIKKRPIVLLSEKSRNRGEFVGVILLFFSHQPQNDPPSLSGLGQTPTMTANSISLVIDVPMELRNQLNRFSVQNPLSLSLSRSSNENKFFFCRVSLFFCVCVCDWMSLWLCFPLLLHIIFFFMCNVSNEMSSIFPVTNARLIKGPRVNY